MPKKPQPKSARAPQAKSVTLAADMQRLALYDRLITTLDKVVNQRRKSDCDDDCTDWTVRYEYSGSFAIGNWFVVETDDSIYDISPSQALCSNDNEFLRELTSLENALIKIDQVENKNQADADLREKTIASLTPEQRRVLGLQ